MSDQEYLFGCFLPYRQALGLSRWAVGLLKLEDRIEAEVPIEEMSIERIHAPARSLFPDLKPPTISEEQWYEIRAKEKWEDGLTDEERAALLEKESEEIAEAIDSGKINIWDDTPNYVDTEKARKFGLECAELLGQKFRKALNPKASFLEKRIHEVIEHLENTGKKGAAQRKKARKGLVAALTLWDCGKIYHEGEPPFQIVLAPQVAELLGMAGEKAASDLMTLNPVQGQQLKRLKAALNVAKAFLPEETGDLEQIYGKIEKRPSTTLGASSEA